MATQYSDKHPDGRLMTFDVVLPGFLVAEQLRDGGVRFGVATAVYPRVVHYLGEDGRTYRLPRRRMFAIARPIQTV